MNTDLISNYIGGISSAQFGGTQAAGFDLNDTAFSDLLNKQMNIGDSEQSSSITGQLGMPPGLEIENLDGTAFSETALDQMEAVGESESSGGAGGSSDEEEDYDIMDLNQDGTVTSTEMLTFFSSLFDTGTEGGESRSELFDFAKKQAADIYNEYSKTVVNSVKDLAYDIQEMIG